MRISDWSSDVCSSDLPRPAAWPGSGRRARAGIVRLATALSFPERSAARLAAATATAQAGRMRDRPPSSPALAGCYVISLRPVGGHAEIGRAHVGTPVTNAHLVCRLLLEKKKHNNTQTRPTEN